MQKTAERVEQPWQITPREQRQCIGVAMLVWFCLIAAAARYGWNNPDRHDGKAGTAWDYAMVATFGIPIGLFLLVVFVAFLSIPFVLIFS
jgi:hypothetical protein